MRILYAIQGTGNGHICRAHDIVPILSSKGEVDVLVSGIQADINVPFPVKYVFKGLSFIFGKKGGVDLFETYKKSHVKQLVKEIRSLPVHEYDLVISDFEPVSAWACVLKNKPCISLSHQAAVLNKKSPQARHIDPVGKAILKVYAPSSVQYGFHFGEYDRNIFTPVIRKEVRDAELSNKGHYTVYLPAYSDKRIISILSKCEGVEWHIFSKHFEHRIESENIKVFPINSIDFINSMASSAGVLCGAGFETPAEALFLKKKLLVVPMKKQFEQHCNAAALARMGVPVIKSLKEKHFDVLRNWIDSEERIEVDYPDNTVNIVEKILSAHSSSEHITDVQGNDSDEFSHKDFRRLTLKRIIHKLSK